MKCRFYAQIESVSHLSVQSSLPYYTVKQPSTTALIANVSSQLFPNASSTSISNFSYIIPFGQKQDCDIYGAICQTGSITVGVNLTSTTTSTVLPCSSYLSAQSIYLEYANDPYYADDSGETLWRGDPGDGSDLADWIVSFGRSPECRSFGEAMSQGQYTLSGCGSSNTVGNFDEPSDPLPTPAGLERYLSPGIFYPCCGNCSLDIPEVRLYYFPDKNSINCQNHTSNITSSLSAQSLRKRVHSLIADGSTAVVSGHTL